MGRVFFRFRPHAKIRRMSTRTVALREIAYFRGEAKDLGTNPSLAAYTPIGYDVMLSTVTAETVKSHLESLGVTDVQRHEMAILGALNFDLTTAGAAANGLSEALLDMEIEIPEVLHKKCLPLKSP